MNGKALFFDQFKDDSDFNKFYTFCQEPWIRKDIKVPSVALTGKQSVGKSLFIDTLVGFPVTFSDPNVGTRMKVHYKLRRSNQYRQSFKINNESCELEEISQKVKEVMIKLQQENQFLTDELLVEINWTSVMADLNIVDLPGLPDSQVAHYNNVKDIIVDELKDESVLILLLVDGSSADPQTHYMESIFGPVLNDIRPNWKKEALVIKNFVNLALYNISTCETLNKYFDVSKDIHHIMLKPSVKYGNIDGFDVAEKSQFIISVRDRLEDDQFDSELERIELISLRGRSNGTSIRSEIKDRSGISFGIKTCVSSIYEKALIAFIKEFPQILKRINEKTEELKVILSSHEFFVNSNNPTTVRLSYIKYVDELIKLFRAILDVQKTIVIDNGKSIFFKPEKYYLLYDDEVTNAHPSDGKDKFRGLLSSSDMANSLKNIRNGESFLQLILEKGLVGQGAYDRFLKVFGYMLLTTELLRLDDELLISAGRVPTGGFNVGLNIKNMVSTVLDRNVEDLDSFISWFRNHLSYLVDYHFKKVQEFLSNLQVFQVISDHSLFHRDIKNKFEEIKLQHLEEITKGIADKLEQSIRAINFETPYRYMALFSMDSSVPLNPPPTPPIQLSGSSNNNSSKQPTNLNISTTKREFNLHAQLKNCDIIDVISGCMDAFSDLSDNKFNISEVKNTVYKISESHFRFILTEIFFTIEQIVRSKNQFFVNQYLDSFNQDLKELVRNISDNDLENNYMKINKNIISQKIKEIDSTKASIQQLESIIFIGEEISRKITAALSRYQNHGLHSLGSIWSNENLTELDEADALSS